MHARGWRRILRPVVAVLILLSMFIPMSTGLLKQDMFPEEPTRRVMLHNLNDVYALERVEAADRIEGFLFENQERFEIKRKLLGARSRRNHPAADRRGPDDGFTRHHGQHSRRPA